MVQHRLVRSCAMHRRILPKSFCFMSVLLFLTLVAARPAFAAGPDPTFLADHCFGCHNETDKKGRLDLSKLTFEAKDAANQAVWIRVHDRVTVGEMPPKSRPRPGAAPRKAFLDGLAKSIIDSEQASQA